MPRSYPDWSNVRKEVSFILREDLAELAARLGSIDVYDRRGYVIWWDDFRRGMGAWTTTLSGTGAAAALSTSGPKWPPFSLKLTGGSDGGRSAQITKYFGPAMAGGIGLEASVDFLSDFYDFSFKVELDNNVAYYQPSVKFFSDTDKIYYLSGAGSWVELDDLPLMYHTFSGYHNVKLVVDFDAGYYIRLLLDDSDYDLSDYALPSTPTFGNHHLGVLIYVRSRDGQNDSCYVDGVIITRDEE